MALLLNSDINLKVIEKIRGEVARIGGSVNQLIDYDLCRTKDINIIDGGFGDIRKIRNVKTAINLLKTIERYIKQDFAYLRHGGKISRDRNTIILDIHDAYKRNDLAAKFDAAISSNVIEHSPNPFFLLLNLYFITRKDGYQFHAIPHFKYTYDMYRQTTPLEHMIADFENESWIEDQSHTEDYIQSAIIKHGWQKEFHKTYPVTYPFMHYHVFDENNVLDMAEFMFEDATVDIYKTEEHSDNVVIFRNTLNKKFSNKYGTVIDKYFKGNT
ncbi:MAG: hypothetical protein AB2L12_10145 [Smithellaceae bacterium]